MTIDERLDKLAERTDAIAQSVELLTSLHLDNEVPDLEIGSFDFPTRPNLWGTTSEAGSLHQRHKGGTHSSWRGVRSTLPKLRNVWRISWAV